MQPTINIEMCLQHMDALITIFGTFLCFNMKSLMFFHLRAEEIVNPYTTVYLEKDIYYHLFIFYEDGTKVPVQISASHGFRGLYIEKLEIDNGKFQNSISIKCTEGYITYRQDNGINNNTIISSDWEAFYLLSFESYKILREFCRYDWLSISNKKIILSDNIYFSNNNTFILGDNIFDLSVDYGVISSRKDSVRQNLVSVDFHHSSVCIDRLIRYNPAVILVYFGLGDIERQFHASINSLIKIGQYRGKIVVITEKTEKEIVDIVNLYGTLDVIVYRMIAFDRSDQVAARLRVAEISEISDCQPLLYADLDVIFDLPLEPFLIELTLSSKMTAQEESFQLRSVGQSVGADLISNDLSPPPDGYGFNSGLMGFPNMLDFSSVFRATQRILVQYFTKFGRDSLGWADQAAINYIAAKFDVYDPKLLTIRTRVPFKHEPFDKEDRRGFVHFWHFGSDRTDMMEIYLNYMLNSEDFSNLKTKYNV